MKITSTLVLLLLVVFGKANAQVNFLIQDTKIYSVPNPLLNSAPVKLNNARISTTSCKTDTVDYTGKKATGFSVISTVNQAGQVAGLGQYFDCPQPITISGFYFYAVRSGNVSGGTNVLCNIYEARADSTIPINTSNGSLGSPVATVTVSVDTTGAKASNASKIVKKAVFSSPVTLNKPYIVAIINPSSVNQVNILTNNFSTTVNGAPHVPDGKKEFLSCIAFQDNTGKFMSLRSNEIQFGGMAFDADILVYPFVKYDVTADFTLSKTTVDLGEKITVVNKSSPVLRSRFYNRAILYRQDTLSFTWKIDNKLYRIASDSFSVSFPQSSDIGAHTFTLYDSLFSYYAGICADSKTTPFNVTSTLSETELANKIAVYPNPSQGGFKLLAPKGFINNAYTIEVYDILGQLIYTKTVDSSGVRETDIQLGAVSPGVYQLKIYNGSNSETIPLLVN